jgi:hypothetical protein
LFWNKSPSNGFIYLLKVLSPFLLAGWGVEKKGREKMACSSVFPPENSTIVFFKWESPVVEL